MALTRFFSRLRQALAPAGEPPAVENIETPLTAYLRAIIAAKGAMTLERYMQIVLQHPDHGYYRQGMRLGVEGDFSTSPETSQMFGEMVGVWCIDAWRRMGQPASFILLELGPGLGTLLQTALFFTQQFTAFRQAMKLCLLESNATLRAIQQEKLGRYAPESVDDLGALQPLPLIVIANEFFDTMPLRQFIRGYRGWHERLVSFRSDRLRLIEGPNACLPAEVAANPSINDLKRGDVFEYSQQAENIMRDLSSHIARFAGAGLIIDYGYQFLPKVSTLDALSKHKYVEILTAPGQVDVTAHVDFSMLISTAKQQGIRTDELINQGEFLRKMGIEKRAELLRAETPEKKHKLINREFYRLTSRSELGKVKVLQMWKDCSV